MKIDYVPLYLAIKNQNIEIVKLLLANSKIDVNLSTVFSINVIIKLQNYYFNCI